MLKESEVAEKLLQKQIACPGFSRPKQGQILTSAVESVEMAIRRSEKGSPASDEATGFYHRL